MAGPIDAKRAGDAKQAADKFEAKSGLPGSRNGPADAFRHCTAACFMGFLMPKEDAQQILDNHEAWVPNSADENQMDLFNNRAGLGMSDKFCPGACRTALDRAELIVLPEDRWSKNK